MSESWVFPDFPFPLLRPANPVGGEQRPTSNSNNDGTSDISMDELKRSSERSESSDTGDKATDPRNVRQARGTTCKTPEANSVHRMVRLFLRAKKLLPDPKDGKSVLPTMPAPVDGVILTAYNNRLHPGPTLSFMPISWTDSMNHPWNQKVIQLLEGEFKQRVAACHYPPVTALPKVGDHFIAAAIKLKLESHRSHLQTKLRKVSRAPELSAREIAHALAEEAEELSTRTRRYERKRNLYLRRYEIIEHEVDSPVCSDPPLWKGIQTVFDFFDEKDMSSDETETEAAFGICKETRRVRRNWVSEDISKIMNFIDQNYQYRTSSGARKRGNPPLNRYTESKKINDQCDPKAGLPRNFYSSHLRPEALETLEPGDPIPLPLINQ